MAGFKRFEQTMYNPGILFLESDNRNKNWRNTTLTNVEQILEKYSSELKKFIEESKNDVSWYLPNSN